MALRARKGWARWVRTSNRARRGSSCITRLLPGRWRPQPCCRCPGAARPDCRGLAVRRSGPRLAARRTNLPLWVAMTSSSESRTLTSDPARSPGVFPTATWDCSNLSVRHSAAASTRGCRIKPFRRTRSTLAEEHLRAAVHDALATDRLRATDEMAIFGPHPYKRSSPLARGFPDSHTRKEHALARAPLGVTSVEVH